MWLDWIEIGTSDFDRLADRGGIGLSIEPVACYFAALPEPKLRTAVGEIDGESAVYWLPPEEIARHGLPDWLRGCNRVGGPHPTVSRILGERGLPDSLVRSEPVPVASVATIWQRFAVEAVGLVKIDAEGMDAAIVRSLVVCCDQLGGWPERIEFEANALTPVEETASAVALLESRGYAAAIEGEHVTATKEHGCPS